MNKKRIIVTSLVGTIALAALSVSISLAWYAASDRLGVQPLEVSMQTNADLKISTSSKLDTFVSDLTNEDLNKDMGEDFLFAPTSSMYKDLWMGEKGSKPVFYDSSNSHMTDANGRPALEQSKFGFFQKDIYLITNLDYYVTLDLDENSKDKCIFQNNEDRNTRRAQELYNEHPEWNMEVSDIKEKLDNLLNCLRVSILVNDDEHYNYYIIDPTKQSGDVTYFGGLLDNNNDGFYDSYVNRESQKKETVYGEVNNRDLIKYNDPIHGKDGDGQPSEQDHEHIRSEHFFGNSFEGISDDTVFTFDKEASLAAGFEFAKEESLSLSDIRNNDNSLLIPCRKNTPTKIVVSIYLEGWDKDCINATMGASFETKLSFKLLRGIN